MRHSSVFLALLLLGSGCATSNSSEVETLEERTQDHEEQQEQLTSSTLHSPTAASSSATSTVSPTTAARPTVGGGWWPPQTVKGCGSFVSQQEAQDWFDYYFDDFGDMSNLDTNKDGIPCSVGDDCCPWQVHLEGDTPTTDPRLGAPITDSEYQEASRPSMDTDLCRLADHR